MGIKRGWHVCGNMSVQHRGIFGHGHKKHDTWHMHMHIHTKPEDYSLHK
jgi:hypothetical protein